MGPRTRAAAESDTDLRAREQDLEPVVALLETELDAEVDRPHDESLHPRLRRDLVCLTQAVGCLDDRNDRRPVLAESVDGLRCRLRQHQHVRPELLHEREVLGEERGVHAVDPDRDEPGGVLAGEHVTHDLARPFLLIEGHGVLEVRHDDVRTGPQSPAQLVVVAGRDEQQ